MKISSEPLSPLSGSGWNLNGMVHRGWRPLGKSQTSAGAFISHAPVRLGSLLPKQPGGLSFLLWGLFSTVSLSMQLEVVRDLHHTLRFRLKKQKKEQIFVKSQSWQPSLFVFVCFFSSHLQWPCCSQTPSSFYWCCICPEPVLVRLIVWEFN